MLGVRSRETKRMGSGDSKYINNALVDLDIKG